MRPLSKVEAWLRVFACAMLGLMSLHAGAWQIIGVMVATGHHDFYMFGVPVEQVINAIPRHTLTVLASLLQVCIVLTVLATLTRRRIALLLLLGAALVHAVIWIRVSYNPYLPALPGIVVLFEETIAMLCLWELSRREALTW